MISHSGVQSAGLLVAAAVLFLAASMTVVPRGVHAVPDACNVYNGACGTCVAHGNATTSMGCAWCYSSQTCVTSGSPACPQGWQVQARADGPSYACSCNAHTTCTTCAVDAYCGWCNGGTVITANANATGRCLPASFASTCAYPYAGVGSSWDIITSECPAPPAPGPDTVCAPYSGSQWGCTDCLKASESCAWCQDLKQCAPDSDAFRTQCGNIFDYQNYVSHGALSGPLLCVPYPDITLGNILMATIGSFVVGVGVLGGLTVARRTMIDERFGRNKVFLFDESTPEKAKARTFAKWLRHQQYYHPLVSVLYCGERDPYGSMARGKWLLTFYVSIVVVCAVTSANNRLGTIPQWAVVVLSFGISCLTDLQARASMCLYRHSCCACCATSKCDACCYDCCCTRQNCACGMACGVRAYCWDFTQITCSSISTVIYMAYLAANSYPFVYGPGVLVASVAAIAQTWMVACVTSAVLIALFPDYYTHEMNTYTRLYGGVAKDGSDVLTAHGQLLSKADAANADPTSMASDYMPPTDAGHTTMVVDGVPRPPTPLMPTKPLLDPNTTDGAAAGTANDAGNGSNSQV